MAKYRGAHLDNLGEQEKQVRGELNQLAQQVQDNTPVEDPEEETFRKRYGDLRTHMNNVMQQKSLEIEALKRQLDDASRAQIKFPKTDEEIEAWSKKYPDVAQIVDTIAQKRANEAMIALDEGKKRLESLEDKLTRKDAEQQLLRLHPDFAEIRQDPNFHQWVSTQPQTIQDALYKNNTDALSAARAIDLYKVDMGKRKKSPKSAAQSVGRTSSSRPTTNGKAQFSESQIERMSMAEYSKNEQAIMEAMSSGNFIYDVSGAAR